ncbi:hypothetical protein HPP92_012413 [Vanilla planifolia]|uniref:Helicase ATP-binding domain-containing protein n=1 Tax=Vanilla planifolia TaxID=51239 RepID=A0A835V2Q3_VANPL|nr:hypothetical protein HPP92_012413 [Vanilla planifolia]
MAGRRGRKPRSNRGKRRRNSGNVGADSFSDEDYVPESDSGVALQTNNENEDRLPHAELKLFPTQPGFLRTPVKRAVKQRKKKHTKPVTQLDWEKWEEDNEKWLADQVAECWASSDESSQVVEIMEPCGDVILPLLRFQKEWLAWAIKQENSDVRGGILADEMGMGKTIQAISLVLTARSIREMSLGGYEQIDCLSVEQDAMPITKCTLVICPVVAVIQWVGEIETHTAKGKVRVLVFHGPKRSIKGYNFNDYDFVITTYSTIENEYRKYMMPPKQTCQYCGKKFYSNKMKTHLTYFCGPYAKLTEKQAKQVRKKKKFIKIMSPKKSNLHVDQRKKNKKKVSDTNWEGSISDMAVESCGMSVLHSIKWERIILDEAHFIKDRGCNTARAVFALSSVYKWALSGTPLQNRVGELYSLVRFVQIYPYSFYLCKDCDCKILDYSTTKDCLSCSHSRVRHFAGGIDTSQNQ